MCVACGHFCQKYARKYKPSCPSPYLGSSLLHNILSSPMSWYCMKCKISIGLLFPYFFNLHGGIIYTSESFYSGMCRYFNSLQSECFPVCFHSNVNMVISAPTGSGKTVLFELCILRLLSRFISEGRFIHIKGTLKTVILETQRNLFV